MDLKIVKQLENNPKVFQRRSFKEFDVLASQKISLNFTH